MRYWDRAIDPDTRKTRSRSIVKGVIPGSQFGQRPMFSNPLEENEPARSELAPEARLDDLTPTDETQESVQRAELVKAEAIPVVILPTSKDNVTGVPTDADFTNAFGDKPVGWIGMVIDAGGAGVVHLVVKSTGDLWYYETLTKAV